MSLNTKKATPTVNVTVEGGFDFWAELENDVPETKEDICLLTQEPLTLNYITMPCGHKYNYVPICKEISAMKSPKTHYYNTGIRLNRSQTFCPYCRQVFNKLLPKIPWTDFTPDKHVCSSTNFIDHRVCEHIFKSGKRKGQACGKKNAFDSKFGCYCSQHACQHKTANKKKSVSKKTVVDLSDEGKLLYKKYKLVELKNILKTNNLPVSGTKAVLVSRLMQANIKLDN